MSGRPPKVTPATPEWGVLTEALDLLTQHGRSTPCVGSDAWTCDDPSARASAALACRACPVLELCAAAATSTRERWGVYGGKDRSPRPGAPRRTA